MKLKKIFVLLMLAIILGITNVKADTINNIDLDINIDKNGDAVITEKWDAKASNGTEWFRQLYDIGNSKLSDFSVSMDGKPLTYKTWNIHESLKEKAGY